MSELITNINQFIVVIFDTLNLFFDIVFNRLAFFGVGVGWYALVFIILNVVIFGIIGGVKND